MRTVSRALLVGFLSYGLLACGSSEPSATSDPESDQSPNRLIVQNLEIPVGELTAFDLIKQYKSHWLWTPKTQSLQNDPQIQVYINNPGGNAGSVSALKRIRANNISEIKYFPLSEAQFRFGLGNSVGAILVSTKTEG